MDSMPEMKPTLYLEGSKLLALGLENPQIGQCIPLKVEACIVGMNMQCDSPCITFDMEDITLDGAKPTKKMDEAGRLAAMFPMMKQDES